jgi:hypothetical protein
MSRAFDRLVLLAAVIATGGCATQAAAPPPRQVNLQGFPPAFKEGYADGCDSARARSVRRDADRYKTDFDYTQGWNDGHSICARRK